MKKLHISFSGGETSAYMVQWCLANLKNDYEMIVVFANTGEENEETLEFVKKCDDILGFNTVWVELVDGIFGKSSNAVGCFHISASRDEVIVHSANLKKYEDFKLFQEALEMAKDESLALSRRSYA